MNIFSQFGKYKSRFNRDRTGWFLKFNHVNLPLIRQGSIRFDFCMKELNLFILYLAGFVEDVSFLHLTTLKSPPMS